VEKRGLLEAVQRAGAKDSGKKSSEDSGIGIVEVKSSGDYLAFLDDGDPIYLPREIMDWLEERQEPESFLQRIARQLKRI